MEIQDKYTKKNNTDTIKIQYWYMQGKYHENTRQIYWKYNINPLEIQDKYTENTRQYNTIAANFEWTNQLCLDQNIQYNAWNGICVTT